MCKISRFIYRHENEDVNRQLIRTQMLTPRTKDIIPTRRPIRKQFHETFHTYRYKNRVNGTLKSSTLSQWLPRPTGNI